MAQTDGFLDPPRNIIDEIQKTLVKFFWTGKYWLKAAVLYLPVHEEGQGLIDIDSRVAVFHLLAAQRLLYQLWMDVACALLRKYRRMGLDKQLSVMSLGGEHLDGLTVLPECIAILADSIMFNRMGWI